jgi:hypothetical protein
MLKASGRKRRNFFFRFIQDEGLITGDDNILEYATNYYKSLFGAVDLMPYTLLDEFPDCLSLEDKEKLKEPFTLEEIKIAIFEIEHNKASGPNGFPADFFQKFRDVICSELLYL